jgi:hypothetical protein
MTQPDPTLLTLSVEDTIRAELDRPGPAHFTRNEIRAVFGTLDHIRAELVAAEARLSAVLALLPADPAEDINASFVPLRDIRAAATGYPTLGV